MLSHKFRKFSIAILHLHFLLMCDPHLAEVCEAVVHGLELLLVHEARVRPGVVAVVGEGEGARAQPAEDTWHVTRGRDTRPPTCSTS